MVLMAEPQNQLSENLYVENLDGKVVLKTARMPHKYLRAHPDFNVNLTGHNPRECEQFLPFQNKDGSWSFLSHHGTWLSAKKNGSVTLVSECKLNEQFWLESW